MNGVKYIVSMGELIRKDNSLCLVNQKGNTYIPIEGVKEIYCLNEVSINTKLLDFLSRNGITIHFFNYYEGYSGTFNPKERYISGKITISQADLYNSNRLYVAKEIVIGIANNIHEVLYHYYRHGKLEIKDYLDRLRGDYLKRITQCQSIETLMSVEGDIWANFYSSFKYFINEDFVLNKRVKRPPDNPINALISFGNSWLYTKVINQIYLTHLDQSISFLHTPRERRFSLSLDLSEAFKPIIVFKTIFDLVNNRKISVEKHFDKNFNYSLLNEEGRKMFVNALEDRIDSVFEHATLKRKVSYKTAIKLDGYKLIKCILEGTDFSTFSLKDKK